MLPILARLALSSFLVWLPACASSAEAPPAGPGGGGGAPDARQILWQRELDAALALARAEGRPLLVALNMDGESASDRIVQEEYRDPAFVRDTRPFVCLVASVFRHTPRDHDEAGRRIPCPRLGEVTCGEHVALEPLLYERFLADGERVAPRHAVLLADGTKAWDLSLSFDLRDIDRALAGSARAERARRSDAELASEVGPLDWAQLAARRDARGRAALEERLARTTDAGSLEEALAALAAHGDAGAGEALRLLAGRFPALAPELRARVLDTARALGLEAPLAEALRDGLRALDPWPGAAGPSQPERVLELSQLAGTDASLRSLLVGARVLAGYAPHAAQALARATGEAQEAAVAARLAELGGELELEAWLAAARLVSTGAREPLPRPGPARDALATREELEAALEEAEGALRDAPEDPALLYRFGKASLDLGRRGLEEGRRDVQQLFDDGESFLAAALAQRPEAFEWWLERARAAYFRARHDEQAAHGRRALALVAAGAPVPGALDGNEPALEALRWIGDADARLVAGRSGGDLAEEAGGALEGLRALVAVAASPHGTPRDWVSAASLAGALGLWREEFALAQAGAERFPGAAELRSYQHNALWNGGRAELVPFAAEALAAAQPGLAEAWWYAGEAWILAAEDARRAEQPERALAAYARADARFVRCAELRADYAASCQARRARVAHGRGLAEARAGRRTRAAEALRAAVELGLPLTGAADGLGYDGFDLVDKVCEWRADGPSPVDVRALAAELRVLRPGDASWVVALSDSQLREALRADGRNPVRALRDTVDAAGKPIRMELGLPDEEGDGYLRVALELARGVRALLASDEDRHSLAQAATIWAERNLERGRLEGVREALVEAAELCGQEPPSASDDLAQLGARAAELRAALGEARPRWRLGR